MNRFDENDVRIFMNEGENPVEDYNSFDDDLTGIVFYAENVNPDYVQRLKDDCLSLVMIEKDLLEVCDEFINDLNEEIGANWEYFFSDWNVTNKGTALLDVFIVADKPENKAEFVDRTLTVMKELMEEREAGRCVDSKAGNRNNSGLDMQCVR